MSSKSSEGLQREKGVSFFGYVVAEVTRGYLLEEDEQRLLSEKQRRVSRFMNTPREVEKLMFFGFCIMLDSFLFVFTILPARFLLALLRIVFRVLTCSRHKLLDYGQKVDIMRASIMMLCSFALGYLDTSALYHMIRGQSVIKLYVFFNMMEIFDRLLASIGQDTLDTLFGLVAENKKRKIEHFEALFYFVIATVYVFLHTILILVQTTTLNVAINSHSKVLLTIMMSNNFVELKGSVFKKFETNNLFQMSCSDIRERFHYVLMLSVVCVRNLDQFNWDLAYLESVVPIVVMVLVLEMFVDSIKHAFITKFNDISPDVYKKYRTLLAMDLVTSRQPNAKSDHADLVSRRMGFIPLPLACLLWNTLYQSLSFPGLSGAVLLVIIYMCLSAFKVLLGVILLGKSCDYRSQATSNNSDLIGQSSSHMTQQRSTASSVDSSQSTISDIHSLGPELNLTPKEVSGLTPRRSTERLASSDVCSECGVKGRPKAKPLSEIERFTLCSNRIV